MEIGGLLESLSEATDQETLVGLFVGEMKSLGYVGFDAFSVDPRTLKQLRRTGNWAVAS